MASFTASILIGHSHPNQGGINPTHCLFLSENSRPALILLYIGDEKKDESRITWIPTLEHLLEDALLMISVHVLKAENLLKEFNLISKGAKPGYLELYGMEESSRLRLHEINQEYLADYNNLKIAVTVFDSSTLERHLPKLKDYSMDIEVCRSSYLREYSTWQDKVYRKGSL